MIKVLVIRREKGYELNIIDSDGNNRTEHIIYAKKIKINHNYVDCDGMIIEPIGIMFNGEVKNVSKVKTFEEVILIV